MCGRVDARGGTYGACACMWCTLHKCGFCVHMSIHDERARVCAAIFTQVNNRTLSLYPPNQSHEQVGYLEHVLAPTLMRLLPHHISMSVHVTRRGFYPKGGGQVVARARALTAGEALPAFDVTERGRVRVSGGCQLMERHGVWPASMLAQSRVSTVQNHPNPRWARHANLLFQTSTHHVILQPSFSSPSSTPSLILLPTPIDSAQGGPHQSLQRRPCAAV